MSLLTLSQACRLLESGELVAIPTETVYGLAADADNTEAVQKIFARKQRPLDHPLIVHVANMQAADLWASQLTPLARQLMQRYWPGPLTLVVERKAGKGEAAAAAMSSIGLRCPSHPLAQQLLAMFRGGLGGLAAPSANRFGHVSPTTTEHVRQEFGRELPVLEGGACAGGIESTILDVRGSSPVLLRPGLITPEQIWADTGLTVLQATQLPAEPAPKVSGALESHYAPNTPARLLSRVEMEQRLAVAQTDIGLLLCTRLEVPATLRDSVRVLGPQAAPYAHGLYAALRELDALRLREIWIEAPPRSAPWAAIHDRLYKACRKD